MLELLTPEEMAAADRLTAEPGPFDGYRLMENAGAAVMAEILKRFPDAGRFDVLCGPGNNGGDGYVVARLLNEAGFAVRLWRDAAPRGETDAARAAAACPLEARALADFAPQAGSLIIDALFGAGLSKLVS
ncbi:MAG TPA: NAD(P)H-hydrate epimerase, partial [Rhizobiaceae bacterium]|nr:NAD(P)H-hydrate epimerase [Rhizobiaceae bacterium]